MITPADPEIAAAQELRQELTRLDYGKPRLLLTSPPSTIYTTPTAFLHVVRANPLPYPPVSTSYNSCLLPVHRILALQGRTDIVVWVTEKDSMESKNKKTEPYGGISQQRGWRRYSAVVKKVGKPSDAEGRRIAWRIVRAIASLHELGKVHREIQPNFLFADDDNEIWLANGIGICGGDDGLCLVDSMKQDAWALGCVLYWLWTGFRAFGRHVQAGEAEATFPDWLTEDKKRILSGLLEVDSVKRMTVLQIARDDFWGPFRDKGLMECMSTMGSGGSTTPRKQSDDMCKPITKKERLPSKNKIMITSESPKAPLSKSDWNDTTEDLPSSNKSPSQAQSSTDFAVDGWDGATASQTSEASQVMSSHLGSLPEKTTSSVQPLYLKIQDRFHGFKVKDRRYHLKLYKKCFVGREAVAWLVEKGFAHNRTDAVYIGQDLLQKGAFRHVESEHHFRDGYFFYTFEGTKRTGDVTEFRKSIILNGNFQWRSNRTARAPVELTYELLKQLIKLCLHHRFLPAPDGSVGVDPSRVTRTSSSWRRLLKGENRVMPEPFPFEPSENIDYVSLRRSQEFSDFEIATAELRAADLSKVRSRQEKIAFAVNVYNLLALHARILQGAPITRSDRIRFFRKTLYRVGLIHLSLDDLLHGILRGNKKSPLGLAKTRQLSHSPRSEQSVKKGLIVRPVMLEALCGISSTSPYDPPIRPLNEEVVDDALQEIAGWYLKRWAQIERTLSSVELVQGGNPSAGARRVTSFALSTVVRTPSAPTWALKLPHIFSACRSDFTSVDELIRWATKLSGSKDTQQCKAVEYWPWDFGEGVGVDNNGKALLCPQFWHDVSMSEQTTPNLPER